MSCDIVSDLTISAIVCTMAGTEYGAAGLHDENDDWITQNISPTNRSSFVDQAKSLRPLWNKFK